jgi:tetratricopeptide (TPR) repeat protein
MFAEACGRFWLEVERCQVGFQRLGVRFPFASKCRHSSGKIGTTVIHPLEVNDVRNTLEKMLRAGHHDLVLHEAEHYFGDRTAPSEEDPWICARAAQAECHRRGWGKAADWAERGLGMTRSSLEVEGLLRFYLGCALFYTSDFYGAQQELEQFGKLAARCPELEKRKGHAVYNLAYVMRALKRRPVEIKLFQQAAEVFMGQGLSGRANICRYEIAWARLLEEQPAKALPELEAAQAWMASEPDAELETDIQIAWALYHHLMGNLTEAQRLGLALLERGELRSSQRSEVVWILARNALAMGDLESAACHVDEAYAGALAEWIPTQFQRVEALKTEVLANCQRGR